MRRFRVLFVATLLLGCLIARATPAAEAIAVTPVNFDFDVAPGTSVRSEITLLNDTESADTFSLEVLNFVAQGEDGAQQYIEEERPSDLASWVTVDRPSVVLEPGEDATFPFVINVPANAEPGGHYASIFFSRQANATAGTGVGIGSKVGVLLLVNVPGDVHEEAKVESFTLRGPAVRSRLPAWFDLRIRNLGSVHFKPRGSLVIRNMFGSVVQRAAVNPKNSAVLPNSVRRVETVWARALTEEEGTGFWTGVRNDWHNFALGRYTASTEVTYGSKAAALASPVVTFWVIPWRLLLLVLAGLVVLITLIKLYNRLLVSSALKKEAKSERRRKN